MITLVFFTVSVLGISYLFLHLWVVLYWPKPVSRTYSNSKNEDAVKFSILIPVRNGVGKIEPLLRSILNQDYPLEAFEVIVIDDHSTDETHKVVTQQKEIKILKLSGYPNTANKKMAIEKGILAAKNPYIITTDADCIWSKNILSALHDKIQEEEEAPSVICGPVEIISNSRSTFREKLEQVDMAGMMLVTNAGIRSRQYYLGNGAFLCYKKADFEEIKPFKDNHHIASGDDVFLVDRMSKEGKKVVYLTVVGSIVRTHANKHWRGFIEQRKRWSGKNKSIGDYKLRLVMAITYLFNLTLWASTPIFIFQGLWSWVLFLWSIKFLSDTMIYVQARKFFSMNVSFHDIPLLSLMHSLYIAIFGTYGILKKKPSQQWR